MGEVVVNLNAERSVLLFEKCPTGRHVGSVATEIIHGREFIPWPLRFICGCVDPRRAEENADG